MTRTELQNIGKAIIKKKNELFRKYREYWELGVLSISDAWEVAVKEICLINQNECGHCIDLIYRIEDNRNGSTTEKLTNYEQAEEHGLLL